MLKIIEIPFTTKYPILYTIKLENAVLSTIDAEKANKVLQYLKTNKFDNWLIMSFEVKRKVIIAGMI